MRARRYGGHFNDRPQGKQKGEEEGGGGRPNDFQPLFPSWGCLHACMHARPGIVTPFLGTLRVHTVNRDACTRPHRHVSIPRMHAHVHAKGCTIDQSLPRIFLQGPCSRTPWFLARDILALPSGLLCQYTGHELLPLCLALATPLFSFLSPRVCFFFSSLLVPTPPLLPVTRYTFYTYGRRGGEGKFDWKAGIRRGVPAADVPRRTEAEGRKTKGIFIQGTRLINARVSMLTRMREKKRRKKKKIIG